jgi:hypothetical protein
MNQNNNSTEGSTKDALLINSEERQEKNVFMICKRLFSCFNFKRTTSKQHVENIFIFREIFTLMIHL